MTLAEFKAWFEGFTEDMEAAPTPKQWKRIKDRVKQIDGSAITREVFYHDRYWAGIYNPPVQPYVLWNSPSTAAGVVTASALSAANSMTDLGKAEYSALVSNA